MVTAKLCGVGEKFATIDLQNLLEEFPSALEKTVATISEQGFSQAENLGGQIKDGFIERKSTLDA